MLQGIKGKWHRMIHWEYWPMWTIYLPLSPLYAMMSICNGGIGFFTRVNPCFPQGGMGLMDKEEMYKLIDPKWYPKTIYISHDQSISDLTSSMEKMGIQFPILIKPAMGCRGRGVTVVRNIEQLSELLDNISDKYLIQDLVDFPNEIGVFYVKFPGDPKGFVSGIVAKKGVEIQGNGVSTIRELLTENPRYERHVSALEGDSEVDFNMVLKNKERCLLSSIGNHARGATFIDQSNWISTEFESVMNELVNKIVGFYYGRIDIKYNTLAELLNLEKLSIMEINGANSEPAHVYDPKHSYLFGLFTFVKHWWWMNKIAWINRKVCSRLSFRESIQLLKQTGMFGQ